MSHYGNDVPFEVPEGWVWCRLGDIAYVAAGSTPSKECFVEHGIPYIKMYNLRNQKIDFDFHPQYIDYKTHTESLHRSMTQVGDIIMNIVGPPLGKLAIIPNDLPEANFNQAAVLIRPLLYKNTLNKYIFRYLEQMSEINSISTKGSAGQVNISLSQSQSIRVPLPSLNEQKRIVEEIDRCFTLLDTLEQNECDLKEAIQKSKSKILDLALSGHLTSDTSHYPQLPDGWENKNFAQLFEVLASKSYQIQQKEIHQSGKYPVISQSASYIEGYSDREEKLYNSETPVIIFGDHTRNVKYVNFDFIVGADGVKILKPTINSKFAYYLTLYNSKQIENRGYSRHFQYLKKQSWRIPSERGQQRIVEIIEHYFRVFDMIITELLHF